MQYLFMYFRFLRRFDGDVFVGQYLSEEVVTQEAYPEKQF